MSIKKPEFTPYISLGTLITAATLVVGLTGSWMQMQAKIDSEADTRRMEYETLNSNIAQLTRENDRFETRVRQLEEQGARTDERFTLILTLMSEMKEQVSALTKAQFSK